MLLDIPPDDHQSMSNAPTTSSRKRPHPDMANGQVQSIGYANDEDDEIVGEDSEAAEDDDETAGPSSEAPKRKRRKRPMNINGSFMEGIPGVNIVSDMKKAMQLQDILLKLCNFPSDGFPGLQPVSMDLKNMQYLHQIPYRVSWKADGTRYMMLIMGEGEVYFFDRDNSCFKVDGLRFLRSNDSSRHLTDTVLDGEMVMDKVGGKMTPRYLVYDIVHFENFKMYNDPFYPNRFHCIRKEVIGKYLL